MPNSCSFVHIYSRYQSIRWQHIANSFTMPIKIATWPHIYRSDHRSTGLSKKKNKLLKMHWPYRNQTIKITFLESYVLHQWRKNLKNYNSDSINPVLGFSFEGNNNSTLLAWSRKSFELVDVSFFVKMEKIEYQASIMYVFLEGNTSTQINDEFDGNPAPSQSQLNLNMALKAWRTMQMDANGSRSPNDARWSPN